MQIAIERSSTQQLGWIFWTSDKKWDRAKKAHVIVEVEWMCYFPFRCHCIRGRDYWVWHKRRMRWTQRKWCEMYANATSNTLRTQFYATSIDKCVCVQATRRGKRVSSWNNRHYAHFNTNVISIFFLLCINLLRPRYSMFQVEFVVAVFCGGFIRSLVLKDILIPSWTQIRTIGATKCYIHIYMHTYTRIGCSVSQFKNSYSCE